MVVTGKRLSPILDRYAANGVVIDVLSIRDKTWLSVNGFVRPFLTRPEAIRAAEMELGL